MTNATITTSQITAPGTHAALANAWSAAMQNTGFTEVGSTVVDSDELRFLEYEYSGSVTYGKFACRVGVFNNGLANNFLQFIPGSDITGGTAINNTGFTAQQSAQNNNGNAWLGQAFVFTEIVHPLVRGVFVRQNGVYAGQSLFYRPSTTLPTFVDENSYPFAFCRNAMDSTVHTYGTQSSLRPIGTSNSMLLNDGNAGGVSANVSDSDKRSIVSQTIISNNNGTGNQNAVAIFDDDLAAVGASGLNILDTFQDGTSTWTLIEPPSTNNLVLAVRTAT